jgi:hypothetical protein
LPPSPSAAATPTPNLFATQRAAKTATANVILGYVTKLAVTLQARATNFAFTPSVTPAPIPTTNPAAYQTWVKFQDAEWGVAFEFPRYFDAPLCRPQCAPKTSKNTLALGKHIEVIRGSGGGSDLTFQGFMAEEQQRFETSVDTDVVSVTWGYVGDVSSATIEYRSGLSQQYGVATYFMRPTRLLYIAAFSVGDTCEWMAFEQGFKMGEVVGEFEAYWQMLATWQFLD